MPAQFYPNIPLHFVGTPEEDPNFKKEYTPGDTCSFLGESWEVVDDQWGSALWEFNPNLPRVNAGKVSPDDDSGGSWLWTGGWAAGALLVDLRGGVTGVVAPHPYQNAWMPHNTGFHQNSGFTDLGQDVEDAAIIFIRNMFPPKVWPIGQSSVGHQWWYFNIYSHCEADEGDLDSPKKSKRKRTRKN